MRHPRGIDRTWSARRLGVQHGAASCLDNLSQYAAESLALLNIPYYTGDVWAAEVRMGSSTRRLMFRRDASSLVTMGLATNQSGIWRRTVQPSTASDRRNAVHGFVFRLHKERVTRWVLRLIKLSHRLYYSARFASGHRPSICSAGHMADCLSTLMSDDPYNHQRRAGLNAAVRVNYLFLFGGAVGRK